MRQKRLIIIAATALLVAVAVVIYIAMIRSADLANLSQWEKDFVGESIWEVEKLLNQRGINLRPGSTDTLERETGEIPQQNEKVLFYVKGEERSWLGPMAIVHGRYLVIDWDQKRVLRVIPFRGKDSL